jgi:aminoglycoside 6'-N-acetyltransferase I
MRSQLWPDCPPERHALEMKQLASSNSGVILVAERQNGRLAGFAEVSIRHDHVDGSSSVPVPYLEGWYVESALRGAGIGRKLLLSVEQWAASKNFTELASDAELANPRSIEAHVSCGFQETCRAVHFIKQLGADGAGDRGAKASR